MFRLAAAKSKIKLWVFVFCFVFFLICGTFYIYSTLYKSAQGKKYSRKQNTPLFFSRFCNRCPERQKAIHTHADIAALYICGHRSTSLMWRVAKGRRCWTVPELLPSMVSAGMSPWGSPKAREDTSSPSWMEKQGRQDYGGNERIDQAGSCLNGALEQHQFLLLLLPFSPSHVHPFQTLCLS